MLSVLTPKRKLLLEDGGGERTVQNLNVARHCEMGVTCTKSCIDGGEFYLGPLTALEAPQGVLVAQ